MRTEQTIYRGKEVDNKILEDRDRVIFTDVDGKKIEADMLWAQYSLRDGAFYIFSDYTDEDGKPIKLLSNEVISKLKRKRAYKKQTDISKMKEIDVEYETEKAYAVCDGSNGCISKQNNKTFYKFYAKSICVEKDGKIYAPIWA